MFDLIIIPLKKLIYIFLRSVIIISERVWECGLISLTAHNTCAKGMPCRLPGKTSRGPHKTMVKVPSSRYFFYMDRDSSIPEFKRQKIMFF